MNSFSERMTEARDVAATRRAKGQTTSVHSSWKVKKQYAAKGSWDALTSKVKKEWRSDVREFLNQFQQYCLNGDDDITQF